MAAKRARTEYPAIRVALVGCGKVASCHFRGIASTGGKASLVAVVDPDGSRRAAAIADAVAIGAACETAAVQEYDKFDKLPASAADLTLLCVPHDLHEDLCMEALARGPFVIEKPLAPSLLACQRLLAAAVERKTAFFVAEQSAYWPEVMRARELIAKGTIGDVVSVHAHYYESLVDTPFGGADRSEKDPCNLGWRASLSRAGGGIVIDGGLHWLRPVRILAGEVVEVVATSARPFAQLEGESLMHALLKCENGREATFRATLLPDARLSSQDPSFRVIGSLGEIVIMGGTGATSGISLYNAEHPYGVEQEQSLLDLDSGLAVAKPIPPTAGFHGAFLPQWADIVKCVAAGSGSCVSPVVEAAKDIAVVEALYRSVLSQRWERVASIVPETCIRASGDSDIPPAIADVPATHLAFLKDSHNIESVRHGGRGTSTLLTHLTEVRYLLKRDLHCGDADLHAAALFHSIYGTEGFQGKTISLDDRDKLKALIGERAEFIAYTNCVMDRSTLDAAVLEFRKGDAVEESYRIRSRAELGGSEVLLSRRQLMDLMLVHFADWAQQVEAYSFWSYRRKAYASIAAALGGICAQVYAETMSREDENAPKEVPEMVRARQLGIFDRVQSGEVAYDHLLDGTFVRS
jgi:predicted dehydrogenase